MKIAFVYDAVYPWETGGAQKRVWELARRLAHNHDVHWYGQHYWEGPPTYERDGVTLHGVCEPRELYVGDRRSITQAIRFTAEVLPELVGTDYDIIDCQEFPYFPCFVSRLTSAVSDAELFITWYEVWGDYWYEYLGKLGYFGKLVERGVVNLRATHIASSKMTKAELHRLGATDVRVSPLGIDFEELQEVESAETGFDFLFGGRLIPEKNADLFVDSINEITKDGGNIDALLIGEGPERTSIEEQIDKYGLADTITIMDFVDHDEFLRYLKATDVFAFPSQREGFGLVGLEALACGTPVVTSNHSQNAAQELISPGQTGYICDLTATELALALQKAKRLNPNNCRDAARQYSWDRIVNDIERNYQKTLSK